MIFKLGNKEFSAERPAEVFGLLGAIVGKGTISLFPVSETRFEVYLEPATHEPNDRMYQIQHQRYGFCSICRSEMWAAEKMYAPGDPNVYYRRPIDSVEHEMARPAREHAAMLVACATPFSHEYDRRWNYEYFEEGYVVSCGHPPEEHDAGGCLHTEYLDTGRVECPCEGYLKPGWLVPAV